VVDAAARAAGGARAQVGIGRRRLSVAGLVAGTAILGGLLVVLPLVRLAWVAGQSGGGIVDLLRSPRVGRALLHSVAVALLAAALAVPVGALAALAVEGTALPGRRLLRGGMLLPLFVPQFVGALSWQQTYGAAGLADRLLGVALPGLVGPTGVVLVVAVSIVPLVYAVVAGALAVRREPDQVRAARAAGATGWQAWRSVTLPLLREPLLAATALAVVVGLDSFAAPAVLGMPAGFETVTTLIYEDLALSATTRPFEEALALSLLLVAVVFAVGGLGRSGRRYRPVTWLPGYGPARAAPPHGRSRWLTGAVLWAYTGLVVGIPLAVLLLTALTRAVGLPPTPNNWTLANFAAAVDGPAAGAFGHSLLLAGVAAVLLLGFGGLLVATERVTGRRLGTVPALTLVLPGSALAVAVLLAYGRWLGDSLAIILVAYLAKLWAVAHQALRAAVDRVPPDAVRASRISGAGPLTSGRTVLLPMLRGPALAAGALVALVALHEVTMSILLYGPGSQTLAVLVLNLQQVGDTGGTAALAVLLAAVGLLAAVPLLHRFTPDQSSR